MIKRDYLNEFVVAFLSLKEYINFLNYTAHLRSASMYLCLKVLNSLAGNCCFLSVFFHLPSKEELPSKTTDIKLTSN